jgi:protein-S-isoprenylcysteine O-methyltransferase Ste14
MGDASRHLNIFLLILPPIAVVVSKLPPISSRCRGKCEWWMDIFGLCVVLVYTVLFLDLATAKQFYLPSWMNIFMLVAVFVAIVAVWKSCKRHRDKKMA